MGTDEIKGHPRVTITPRTVYLPGVIYKGLTHLLTYLNLTMGVMGSKVLRQSQNAFVFTLD